ncbi:MAG TPA: contractile injection system protein, VgrG/Pvc8 family, partial [Myxococcaceae bacterium]
MGALVITISSEGKKLDPTVEILSVEVRREVNRVSEAEITLNDGSVAERKFELSDTPLFVPGKKVSIAAREGDAKDAVLFEGLVVRHAVESRPGSTSLRVELKDAAFKLTRRRRSAVFRSQTDDEAFRKLISDAGLKAGDLKATRPKHAELVQYLSTDWDFIVSRADSMGLAVDAHRGTVSVQPLVSSSAAKLRLEHGMDDVELELELDATDQWAEMTTQAWDVQDLKATQSALAADPKVKVGNVDAASIARDLGGSRSELWHPAPVTQDELSAWADGRLARSRLTLLRGTASIPGNPALAPLDVVEIAGVGDRFNGKALVTGVTNRLEHASGWRTELRFGLSPEIFARQPDIADVPAA